ncbi:MAG: hypothetical protein H8E48_05165, partial [Chloroflexi bacterium]|nr:hypothetical protein [Chloroflexota bacterium]
VAELFPDDDLLLHGATSVGNRVGYIIGQSNDEVRPTLGPLGADTR